MLSFHYQKRKIKIILFKVATICIKSISIPIVAIVFSLSANANHQKWSTIAINLKFSYLLDESTVFVDGYSVIASIGVVPHLPIPINNPPIGSVYYSIKADCISKTITPKKGIIFDEADVETRPTAYDAMKAYHEIVTSDVEHSLIQELCIR
jgi:hypothetical protein